MNSTLLACLFYYCGGGHVSEIFKPLFSDKTTNHVRRQQTTVHHQQNQCHCSILSRRSIPKPQPTVPRTLFQDLHPVGHVSGRHVGGTSISCFTIGHQNVGRFGTWFSGRFRRIVGELPYRTFLRESEVG